MIIENDNSFMTCFILKMHFWTGQIAYRRYAHPWFEILWLKANLVYSNFEFSRLERLWLLWWVPEFRVSIFWHSDRFECSECIHRSILVTCHLSPDHNLSPTSSAKRMSNLNLKIIWTRLFSQSSAEQHNLKKLRKTNLYLGIWTLIP